MSEYTLTSREIAILIKLVKNEQEFIKERLKSIDEIQLDERYIHLNEMIKKVSDVIVGSITEASNNKLEELKTITPKLEKYYSDKCFSEGIEDIRKGGNHEC